VWNAHVGGVECVCYDSVLFMTFAGCKISGESTLFLIPRGLDHCRGN